MKALQPRNLIQTDPLLVHLQTQLLEFNDKAIKYDMCTRLRVEQIFKRILPVAAARCQRIKARLAETKRIDMSASLVRKFSFFLLIECKNR